MLFDSGALLLTVMCVFSLHIGATETRHLVIAELCLFETNGPFKLHCEDHQYMEIFYSELGRSDQECHSNRTCCPSRTVCKVIQQLKETSKCYGKQECDITFTRDKCNYSSKSYETDYKLVKIWCYNNTLAEATSSSTTSSSTTSSSTTSSSTTSSSTTSNSTTSNSTTSSSTTSSSTTSTDIVTTDPTNGHTPYKGDNKMETANRQTNTALIVGLVTAACVVVIAVILVVILYERRQRRPENQPAMASQSTQTETNLNDTDSNRPEQADANPYETMSGNTRTHPHDEIHAYDKIGQTVAPTSEGRFH